jgi:hypothetical protein
VIAVSIAEMIVPDLHRRGARVSTHARPDAHAERRTPGRAARRCRLVHLGSGGDRLEQRLGIPVGQRAAGDGDRRVQRKCPIGTAKVYNLNSSANGTAQT